MRPTPRSAPRLRARARACLHACVRTRARVRSSSLAAIAFVPNEVTHKTRSAVCFKRGDSWSFGVLSANSCSNQDFVQARRAGEVSAETLRAAQFQRAVRVPKSMTLKICIVSDDHERIDESTCVLMATLMEELSGILAQTSQERRVSRARQTTRTRRSWLSVGVHNVGQGPTALGRAMAESLRESKRQN